MAEKGITNLHTFIGEVGLHKSGGAGDLVGLLVNEGVSDAVVVAKRGFRKVEKLRDVGMGDRG